MSKADFFIAVPTFENVTTECFESIFKLTKQWNIGFEFKTVKGYDCARARNEIIKEFFKTDCNWLWMIDSDTVLPSEYLGHNLNFLEWLIVQNRQIILGWYPRKNDPGRTEVFMEGYKGYPPAARWNTSEMVQRAKINRTSSSFMTNSNPDFIPIKGGGMGCALIHRSVLENLEYPYFKYDIRDNGTFLSEDLYFCEKAREKGYQIWTMPVLGCDHIGKKTVKAFND